MNRYLVRRRDFLAASLPAYGALTLSAPGTGEAQKARPDASPTSRVTEDSHLFNGPYQGANLSEIAFPLGGMGAGMISLEGMGAISRFSIRHDRPPESDRRVFAALAIRHPKIISCVLEGPVPHWKLRQGLSRLDLDTNIWGLPRFREVTFQAAFPFATVHLRDVRLPLEVTLTGWSPFSPGDADNSSLPVAGLEYTFDNRAGTPVEAVFSFNAENFLTSGMDSKDRLDRILPVEGGFVLYDPGAKDCPWDSAHFAAWIEEQRTGVVYEWPMDNLSLLWNQLSSGNIHGRAPLQDAPAAGASLFVPLTIAPGETRTITVKLAWYAPNSNLYEPESGLLGGEIAPYPAPKERYRPWYASRFSDINSIVQYWRSQYQELREVTQLFSKTFHDSTLPPEVVEATSSNLCILKSPTVLREYDGKLWGREGTLNWEASKPLERTGVSGTTTHVWNYAQSIPHLFPQLERGLRETEFFLNQTDEGLQYCRTPLPIRPIDSGHTFPDGPAADGQLGGIIKLYREWRISGDTTWLRRLWPKARASLEYCIRTWDPRHKGVVEEPHLTGYDMKFWGADSYSTSLYLGALKAASLICEFLHEPATLYSDLLHKCREQMETRLFNGEYFFQNVEWKHLNATFPPQDRFLSKELLDLFLKEGPIGQYGSGCLSEGVMGEWLSAMSGMEGACDTLKVKSHLTALRRYNFKEDLTDHTNLWRACLACGGEAGLILCSWPKGSRPSWPPNYIDEGWSGVEYQVASHLIWLGNLEAGLDIVRATRRRYDGRARNPFAEVEAGQWYARAMSSYSLLQAFSGARFDAVEQILYLRPRIRGDFRSFLCTATGYGTVGVKNGAPFVEVAAGRIPYREIRYTPASAI